MKIDNNNPFVGLRPFEMYESILFFGRSEQTLELLQRLHQHQFVAVVGSSGCGKSSLLRAGLIPALKAGYLVDDSDHWFIAIMKPGQSPLYNLAETLLQQINSSTNKSDVLSLMKKINEEGSDAILNLITPLRKEQNINFFLLIDQFEELFRLAMDHKDAERKDEAIDFVNIILELSQQKNIPFYVVLTMRSDFIGDCAQFYGLPEAMNKSQYLVPRLNRVEMKMAIEGPAKLYGGKFNPALTSKLLNELNKVKDELPLLQHALMRMWDFEMNINKSNELDLEDYKKIGGLEKALSNHADEALKGLSDEDLKITKGVFQALTAIDENGRKIRRPVLLSELKQLTHTSEDKLLQIISLFIEDRRSFLVISKAGTTNDKVIDISHESLIRQWNTLSQWVDEEGESASNYLQLGEAARLQKQNKKDFLSGSELQIALEWYDKYKPSATWANRYKSGFEECEQYLLLSEQEHLSKQKQERERVKQEKRRKQTQRLLAMGIGVLLLIAAGAFLSIVNFKRKNDEIERKNDEIEKYFRAAVNAADTAKLKAKEAIDQQIVADSLRRVAVQEKNNADSFYYLFARNERALREKIQHNAGQEIQMQRNNSKSFNLIIAAENVKEKDPTKALRIAEAAMRLNPDPFVTRSASEIYFNNNFYNIIIDDKTDVIAIASSPDGNFILSGGDDLIVRLLNLQGETIAQFRHSDIIRAVAFSPDGKTILTAADDGKAILWDLKGNKLLEIKKHSGPVRSVAFSPDGNFVLTGSTDRTAWLWNLKGDSIQIFKRHNGAITSVAFSPDGKYVLTGSEDKTAIFWDLKGNPVNMFTGHRQVIRATAFSPDGKSFLTASEDSTTRVWSLKDKTFKEFKGHQHIIRSAVFSPNGQFILTGSDDETARLWNLTNQSYVEFKGHTKRIRSVAFSYDGNYILTGSNDNSIRQWFLKDAIREFRHDDFVRSVIFSPDGKYILTGCEDNISRLWDLNGTVIQEFKNQRIKVIRCVAFSPDGKYILTGSNDKLARLWDMKGNVIQEFIGHADAVRSVAFSPDGKKILTGSYDNTAKLWDMNGKMIREFKGHTNFIRGVTFSPHGKLILTGSYDKTARLWNLDGEMIKEFSGHTDSIRSVAFSPDGKGILTSSNDKTARLWDLNGNIITEFWGHTDYVRCSAFSTDGKYILTGSNDKTIRLWDSKGNTIQVFKGHTDKIRSVAFSPDGKYILSGSDDKTARIWRFAEFTYDLLNVDKIEPLTPQLKKEFRID